MSSASDRQSFWTTLPGLLTGTAALVTAIVGAVALLASPAAPPGATGEPEPSEQRPPVDATTTESPDGTGPGPSAPPERPSSSGAPAVVSPVVPGGGGGTSEEYLLFHGGMIDVDSGQFGSGVEDAELRWGAHADNLEVLGERHVRVDAAMDGPDCAAALARGADDEDYGGSVVRGGLAMCVRSDRGRLALLMVDPVTDEDRLPVHVTTFGS